MRSTGTPPGRRTGARQRAVAQHFAVPRRSPRRPDLAAEARTHCVPPKAKPPQARAYGGLGNKSLTMTYFHRRPSTIIGAKAFHCPVRDGKEWYHLAMVVRRNWLRG